MTASILGLGAPRENLQRLLIIRWLLMFFLLAGTGISLWGLGLALPYGTISVILVVIILFNLGTWWRLHRPWVVTPLEFFLQILVDILGVTVLFYYAGGGSNPFVFYYLVPLSISAATLTWRYTSALALLSVFCYTLLLFYYVPIPDISPAAGAHIHEGGAPLNAHILGMWFNFIIGAGLITFFVVRMSNALRIQQQQLNEHREENLRDEQVLAVATLAAGTAHELGSPLTTMKLLLNEMAHDYRSDESLAGDLGLLQQQVNLCSKTLKDLVRRADTEQTGDTQSRSIGEFCNHIIDRWRLLRPKVDAEVYVQPEDRERPVLYHSTVEQAIINLLNNAADAAREQVKVRMEWNEESLKIVIIDDGGGMPENIRRQLGQPFVTTKGKGLGLGVFLSNATITRYGGRMTLKDNLPGGTRLTIELPMHHDH